MKSIFAILAIVTVFVTPVPAFAKKSPVHGSYIVIMAQDSALAFKGEIAGLEAARSVASDKRAKISPSKGEVKAYIRRLQASHDAALKAVGVGTGVKTYSYTHAFNGFAALLSKHQAAALTKQPGVVFVISDEMRFKTTDSSPRFLGLTGEGGLREQGLTGEDVVVGVIDTGIWPEHPSFADDASYDPLPVTLEDTPDNPACNFGNLNHNINDAPFTCNNKLLGARQFLNTYKAQIGLTLNEFDSARDDNGHGTHTASTAVGNAGVEASIFDIPRGIISGIAPRARVIAYKGLGELGGFSSDLVAAIDQAVADGVDVINYSVGGGASLTGADDIAFLFAADAGVFVATSAGNSGPNPATIGGPASVPWLTSVGASTQDRAFISEIQLQGPDEPPRSLWGGSVTNGIENFNLVNAEGIADSAGDASGQCLNAFSDSTFQANDAVLCNQYDFGVARSQRVTHVADAGGGAVIFHNSSTVNITPTDNHPLPTVHMLYKVGNPLKAYLLAHPGQVSVSFTQSEASRGWSPRIRPYMMTSFSSRGPDPVTFDIIKPDVTAPGFSILALPFTHKIVLDF